MNEQAGDGFTSPTMNEQAGGGFTSPTVGNEKSVESAKKKNKDKTVTKDEQADDGSKSPTFGNEKSVKSAKKKNKDKVDQADDGFTPPMMQNTEDLGNKAKKKNKRSRDDLVESEPVNLKKLKIVKEESDDMSSGESDFDDLFDVSIPFDIEEYDSYFKDFKSDMENSIKGKWGNLYRKSYEGVVKLRFSGKGNKGVVDAHATGFILYKNETSSIVLTVAHSFVGFSQNVRVNLITSEFLTYEAEVWHLLSDMDICLLRVNVPLNQPELPTHCRRVYTLEKVIGISCAYYNMRLDDSVNNSPWKEMANTLWFSVGVARVSHPKLINMHPDKLKGNYIQLDGGNWDSGSSGCPILNEGGKVIGIYVSSIIPEFEDSTAAESSGYQPKHMGLRLNSVRDHLEILFNVPKEKKGKGLRTVIKRQLKAEED